MMRLGTFLLVLLLLAFGPRAAEAQEWTAGPPVQPELTERPARPAGWTTVRGTWVELHGHESRADLLLRLSRHAAEALPRLAERLEVPPGGTIHVYVASTEEQFRSLQPGDAPTWADATAYPSLGVVFLRDPRIRIATDEPVEQVLDHELVHILLGRAFAPEVPPAWLQEGAAQVLAHQTGTATMRTMSSAALQGTIMGLESLERGFPRDPVLAQVAYAVSADFVQYLQVQHGERVIPELVHASLGGRSLKHAVRAATGASLDDVEASWRGRWTTGRGISAGIFGHLAE